MDILQVSQTLFPLFLVPYIEFTGRFLRSLDKKRGSEVIIYNHIEFINRLKDTS